ncbi:MAG: hypothetical protein IJD89_05620 [Clostridia bacterium]|nr:hypothetical protein [Clostridia bacterium]
MNFFKVKHISVKMDGSIVFQLTTGDEVRKTECGYIDLYQNKMTPLFDFNTGDLVGFFNPKELTIELEED